jgi:hypothetical protein
MRLSSAARIGSGTGAWICRALGILLSSGILISLIKEGLAIEVSGVPAEAFAFYAWARDMLFEPLMSLVPTIPAWVKDALMGYALVCAVHVRTITGALAGRPDIWRRLHQNLFAIVFFTAGFFAWQYLQSGYGPPA